jgi:hypothetical protein
MRMPLFWSGFEANRESLTADKTGVLGRNRTPEVTAVPLLPLVERATKGSKVAHYSHPSCGLEQQQCSEST